MIAVQKRPGPHHVGPGLRPRGNRGAVGDVHDPADTPRFRNRWMAPWKPLQLIFGLLANRRVSVNTSEDARWVNVPFSSKCLHLVNCPAKQSISLGEIPRRFIPVSSFK